MSLTKNDKDWILTTITESLKVYQKNLIEFFMGENTKLRQETNEKISHLPTVEQLDSSKDEILTELRKVRT